MSRAAVFALYCAGLALFTGLWWKVHRPAHVHAFERCARDALSALGSEVPVDLTLHHLDAVLYGFAPSDEERRRMADRVAESCPQLAGRLVNRVQVEDAATELPPERQALAEDLGLRMANVRFGSGRDRVGRHDLSRIKDVARRLQAKAPGAHILLVGRADPVADERSNLQLGLRRARFVRDKLVEQGVEAWRVGAVSMDEQPPPADSDEADAMRRVDLYVLD